MAHPYLSTTLAAFEARIHNSKNRLIAIPAEVQRALGLKRRPDNHLACVSIRPRGKGRWNHHYFKLTSDNEFTIPADVARLKPGATVEVKIHRIIPDESVPPAPSTSLTAAGVLLELAKQERPGWRTDGAERHDEYLNEQIRAKGQKGGVR